MTLTLTELVSLTGCLSQHGRRYIDLGFAGNRLAVHLRISPNLDRANTIIGVLTQHFGGHRCDYQIRASQTVLSLHLPQTNFLSFFPISSLYDEYGLDIAYTTVGDTVSEPSIIVLPESIALLPDRVASLESYDTAAEARLNGIDASITSIETDLANLPSVTSIDWSAIENKPITFTPSAHTHSISEVIGLEDELVEVNTDVVNLTNRVGALESATHATGSVATTLLNSNITLESNKTYLATGADLVCALPTSPSIGDVIALKTGNFSLRINHGNASQQILNNSTSTPVGALNGIILKAYADISLVFLGSNLWKTSYRVKTTNNWIDTFTETVASIKSYTATPLETYTYNASGNNVNLIHDGNKTSSGVMRSGGGTLGELRILLTFPYPTSLTSFNYWLGQFNGSFNMPTSVDVYIGSTVTPANLKGAIALSGTTGSRNVTNTDYSTQYVFVFKLAGSGSISVLELEAVGTQIISGEIAVTQS